MVTEKWVTSKQSQVSSACRVTSPHGSVSIVNNLPRYIRRDSNYFHFSPLKRISPLVIFTVVCMALWFVGFCYLTNNWMTTVEISLQLIRTRDVDRSGVTTALAFLFFGVITWVGVKDRLVITSRTGNGLLLF
ncbi:unnamed protein product [Protopolystoma xenopodis]|uniref:Uncharacterized protein n=1 Tax=Protopolystoma xenopodis TaxID=117903 RepID=A0A448X152_9PLAT|nr:unnamed protein product [Protopolystoma xenopodis]